MNKKLFAGLIGILAVGCTVLQSNPSRDSDSLESFRQEVQNIRKKMKEGFRNDPFGYANSKEFHDLLDYVFVMEVNSQRDRAVQKRHEALENGIREKPEHTQGSIVDRIHAVLQQSPWQRIRKLRSFDSLIEDVRKSAWEKALGRVSYDIYVHEHVPSGFAASQLRTRIPMSRTIRFLLKPEKANEYLERYLRTGGDSIPTCLASKDMQGNMRELKETTRLYDQIKEQTRQYEKFARSQD